MTKNIKPCKSICNECGFILDGTKDTLYAEAFNIIDKGIVFPCHMYLKSKTGCEYLGAETLSEIQVCRGYINYMFINHQEIAIRSSIWSKLFEEVSEDDRSNIYSPDELIDNHIGLRKRIYLGN